MTRDSRVLCFSESGAGHAGQTVRAAEVSGGGEAAGGALQVVRPPLPRQRPRPEEGGHHVGEGDRRHPAEAARHLEEESIRHGQRRTARSRQALNDDEEAAVSKPCSVGGERTEAPRRVFIFTLREGRFLFSALRLM